MKKLGIIGGFGPSTTAEFFLSLISAWNKTHKIHRPEIIIWNAPVNKTAERKLITQGLSSKQFLPLLKTGILTLEKAGANILVLPCNSLHIFIKDISLSTKLPMLNILEETTEFLKENKINKIVLLGSEATVKMGLFNKIFRENEIELSFPNRADQLKLNKIIHNLVSSKNTKKDTNSFNNIIIKFRKLSLTNVLLACTDLQLLKPNIEGVRFIDTLEILKNAALEKMGE